MSTRRYKEWAFQIEAAKVICAAQGCEVELSTHDYEIARVTGEGVSLIIYPHKTKSTGNRHARVRDNNSKDKAKARAVITAMGNGDGMPEADRWRISTYCTFYCKTMP